MKVLKPTPDRKRRIEICDMLFRLHNGANVAIGQAVQNIMAGRNVKAEVAECCRSIIEQMNEPLEKVGHDDIS